MDCLNFNTMLPMRESWTLHARSWCIKPPVVVHQAFAIGLYQLVYTIDVRVVTPNDTQVLRLGPRNPSGTTNSRGVQAQLVGEFASFGENPSMQDRTLFIPAERQGVQHCPARQYPKTTTTMTATW